MTAQSSMSGHHDGDAAGYAMYSDSTELTPVTHRPSRAKKGKRVHYCDVCNKVSLPFKTQQYWHRKSNSADKHKDLYKGRAPAVCTTTCFIDKIKHFLRPNMG